MSKLTIVIWSVIVCLLVSLGWSVNHYRDNATEYKKQRDEKVLALGLANATISDMTTRQRDVAALDVKYTKELADAQKNISDLHGDVESGRKQLHVAATCNNVRKAATATGVDDATSVRLTDSSQRDYFTLRERIEIVTKQLTGLQVYVREQCHF